MTGKTDTCNKEKGITKDTFKETKVNEQAGLN